MGKKSWDLTKGTGEYIGKAIEGIALSLAYPETYKVIAAFYGIEWGPKIFWRYTMKQIMKNLETKGGELVGKEMAEMAAKEGVAITNTAIVSDIIKEGVEASVGRMIAMESWKFIGGAADSIFNLAMLIQLLGMVLDMWDPCEYGKMMDAEMMKKVSDSFNELFSNALGIGTIGPDEFGRYYKIKSWPMEYFMDNIIQEEKPDVYKAKSVKYQLEYFKAMTYNSNGLPVSFPKKGTLINPSELDKALVHLVEGVAARAANDNVDVENYLEQNWEYIIIVCAIVILFLFLIR